MAEDNKSLAKERLEAVSEEVQTKGIYIALALLFVASSAGVFAAEIPTIIFVALFLVAVGIDAYN